MTKSLNRAILNQPQGLRKTVRVPEWDGDVLLCQLSYTKVKEITALAREAVNSETKDVRNQAKLDQFNFQLIQESWVDDDGALVLADEDMTLLFDAPNSVIDLLVTEVRDFNRLGQDAKEEAAKN